MPKKLKPAGSIKKANTWELTQEVDRLCDEMSIPRPGEFLANVMAGRDPRPDTVSRLWKLVNRIARAGRLPDESEWEAIKDIIVLDERYRGEWVTLSESKQAAKDLMDYLYAKQKSVELSGKLSATVAISEPLNLEEIKQLNEIFLTDF